MNDSPKKILRVRFSKQDKIRFISHRDLARVFERTLRAVRLPMAYSQGFSPRPKLSFGLALSVSHESDAEYLDIELTQQIQLEDLPALLNQALPNGLSVEAVAWRKPGAGSLQQSVCSSEWRIQLSGASEAELEVLVDNTLAQIEIPFEHKRKNKATIVNVRPAIIELRLTRSTGGPELLDDVVTLETLLSTQSPSLRPEELVQILAARSGRDLTVNRIRRLNQWMIVDGVRSEPLRRSDSAAGLSPEQVNPTTTSGGLINC